MGPNRNPAWINGYAGPTDTSSGPEEYGTGAPNAVVVAPYDGNDHPDPAPDVMHPASSPTWWALLVAVGGALVFFAIALFAPDWGEAARQSAWLATVLGVICVLTGLLYLLAGGRPHWLRWLILGGVLAILGLYELPASVLPLHLAQAQMDEAGHHYGLAYTEYRLAGVPACDARVTGVLLSWAQSDERTDHYGDAIVRLKRLGHDCPNAPAAQKAHDQIGQFELLYGEQLLGTGDYKDAIAQFDTVQHDYVTTPLALAARQHAAAAYTQWADSEEHAGKYASALAKYQAVLGTYPDSAYAPTARNGAAQTLFDWGQWDTRNARYDEAAQHYSQLVDNYPGTPQADAASKLLRAPQMVVGRLVHNNGSAAAGVRVRLSSEWQIGGGSYSTGGAQYTAVTDATGIFTLSGLPPGDYLLEWVGANGRYSTFVNTSGQPDEVVTVSRLHPLELGNVDIDPSGDPPTA